MTITELVASVGDEAIAVQFLDQCTDTANMNAGVTRITFGTHEPILVTGKTARLGVVLWLPREAVKAALAAKRPTP